MQNIVIDMPIDDKLKKKLEIMAKDEETPQETLSRLSEEWSDEQDREIRKKAKHYRLKLL